MKELIKASTLPAYLSTTPKLIDVRSEDEYQKGSVPDSLNLPLLVNDERRQVGIEYKLHGQNAALELGHRLVSGETRERRLLGWREAVESQGFEGLFCARGGLRSEISQRWLREYRHIPRIEGGYKAIRKVVLSALEKGIDSLNGLVLTGKTGCGKTALLPCFSRIDSVSAIDLEALALHRGSAFGDLYGPQPSQATFENALGFAILREQHSPFQGKVLFEDESRLIGKCCLPNQVFQALRSFPMVELVVSKEERINNIIEDYFEKTEELLRKLPGEDHRERLRGYLLRSLLKLERKLGGALCRELQTQVQEAFQNQKDPRDYSPHQVWIGTLLSEYYDRYYSAHIERNRHRILFSGGPEEIAFFLKSEVARLR